MIKCMETYTGSIQLPSSPSPQPPIEDIHLSLPTNVPQTFSLHSNATLTYLALVDPTLIPLYLAAGPCLDVWTDNEETVQWFADQLLSENTVLPNSDGAAHEGNKDTKEEGVEVQPWWESRQAQSDVGILVRVEEKGASSGLNTIEGNSGPRITEILLYASVIPANEDADGIPTPPSSSAHSSSSAPNTKPVLRVHALPLSSDLLYHPSVTTNGNTATPLTPSHTDTEPLTEGEARFLPPLFPELNPPEAQPRKRARVATLFDDATERRKKARRKGGEGVAKAMAGVEGDGQGVGIVGTRKGKHDKVVGGQDLENQQPPLVVEAENERAGSVPSGRRSTLSRVPSAIAEDPSVDKISQTTEARNKDTLSRIIMAGMRIYGLQQRKKPINTQPDSAGEADEYKIIYHQTFKGACFAFRTHITKIPLKQETMRDVVDRLLALYCNDPLRSSLGATFGEEKDDKSPFAARVGKAVSPLRATLGLGDGLVSLGGVR
ncbi:MAG: hypothetical protein M1836_004363 [Candelina mexicana]|nr:MAG: hypothetical protein M1836_004363 [Candelina mexicana]